MKHMLIILLCAINVLSINAQNIIKIDLKNNQPSALFFTNYVDSISHQSSEYAKVYSANNVFDFSYKDIAQFNFLNSTNGYYNIPNGMIDEWDGGCYFSSGYFALIKVNEENDEVLCYINKLNSNNKGILAYLDLNHNINSIASESKVLYVKKDEVGNKLMICVNTNSGKIEEWDEMTNIVGYQAAATRAMSSEPIKIVNDIITTKGRYDAANYFFSGDWDNMLNNIGNDIAGTMLGAVMGAGNPIGLVVAGSFYALDRIKKNYENIGIEQLLGNISIVITNVERIGYKKMRIKANVSNASSRPYGKRWSNKQIEVKAGCYFRKDLSTVSYQYKDGESAFVNIESDGEITFEIDVPTIGSTYFVVPVLIPFKYFQDYGRSRYGSTKSIYFKKPSATIKSIENVDQTSCSIICEFSDIWPEIDCYCDIEGGGKYYTNLGMSENGTQTYNFHDLRPNTSYKAVAYPKYEGNEEYSQKKQFTTLAPDMTGTWLVTQSDGGSFTVTFSEGQCSWSNYMERPGSYGFSSNSHTFSFSVYTTWDPNYWSSYAIVHFTGEVNDLTNPTSISGSSYKIIGNGFNSHEFEEPDFIAIKQ